MDSTVIMNGSEDETPNIEEYVGWNENMHSCKCTTDFYNENAKTYELGVKADDYNGPTLLTPLCLEFLEKTGRILDAGSGTGILGKILHAEGFTDLHALDASKNMLEIAEKADVYKSIINVYLEPNNMGGLKDNNFDGLVSVGTFGPGMMTPDVFPLFVRLVKPGGRIVFGTRERWMHNLSQLDYPHWDWDAYTSLDQLESEGKIKMLHKEVKPNHCSKLPGFYCVFEVC